jgi:hypothetical protein
MATTTLRVSAAGKPRTEGFELFPCTRGPKDPATVTCLPPSFDTHYPDRLIYRECGPG